MANVAFARDELKELRASLDAMRGKGTRDLQSSEERIDEMIESKQASEYFWTCPTTTPLR